MARVLAVWHGVFMPHPPRRSYAKISKPDLKRLAAIARADNDDFFRRNPLVGRLYRSRLLCTALCQGAALHYVDGRNGVKDFDVWSFFAEHPGMPYPPRRHATADFGHSKFGRPRADFELEGRRVDLLGRSLPVRPSADPVEAVLLYLLTANTKSSKLLKEKAVVLLDPPELLGAIVWPPALAR